MIEKVLLSLRQLGACQKPKRGTPAYTRIVNRRAGRLMAAILYVIRATPNQATILNVLFTGLGFGIVVSFEPTLLTAIVATTALLVGFAFDSADGQLARLSGKGSPVGEWLDHSCDCLKQVVFHASVFCLLYFWYEVDSTLLLLPFAFLGIQLTVFTSNLLKEKLMNFGSRNIAKSKEIPEDKVGLLRDIVIIPTDYGLLCFLFVIAPWPGVFINVYTGMCVVNVVVGLLILSNSYRRLRVIGVDS